MNKKEIGVCYCGCHEGCGKHIGSCCQICEKCGKNIKYGFMEIHEKKCLKKRPKKD